MTDPRPEPKYGQYGPVVPPVAETPPLPPPPPPVAVQANRTRDVVITTILLLVGVFDVVTAFATFADLGPSLSLVYKQLGIEGSVSATIAAPYGVAINIVRIAVLVVTIAVSLLLIARHRRAFWVPLAGYVLAGLVTSGLVVALMLNDPAYQAWLAQYQ